MSQQQAHFERFLLAQWQKKAAWYWLTLPLSGLFCALAKLRRWAYKSGLKKRYQAPLPVIVVGNLTVGGTGKSPLVAYLVDELKKAGWRPAIISRGYKSAADKAPRLINDELKPGCAGDEAVMLAEKTGVPVVVGSDRVASVQKIVAENLGDVVVSDDGFQHLKLARDVQLLVVDGARGYGNGACLPSGPLREPVSAEQYADAVVVNGDNRVGYQSGAEKVLAMQMQLTAAVPLFGGERRELEGFSGQAVHAVAGIGHPQRFFDMLEAAGLDVVPHAFADHHDYLASDVDFADENPVLVTEKDAVKLRTLFASQDKPDIWVVAVRLDVDNGLITAILDKLGEVKK